MLKFGLESKCEIEGKCNCWNISGQIQYWRETNHRENGEERMEKGEEQSV